MTTVRITDAGGNKPTFVQWDVDRTVIVSGVASQPMLHFANAELRRAIVVPTEETSTGSGKWKADVPNYILQFALPVIVSVFTQPEDGEGRTEATVVFGVQPKKKPQDYTYEENIGYINWVNLTAEIQRMLDDGELKGDTGPAGGPPAVDTEITYYGNKVTFTGSNGPKTINVLDGMTATVKAALLGLLEHVAYVDDQGQTYYDALDAALNPVLGVDYITVVFDPGTAVIYNTDELASLKPYITCTAHYEDGTSAVVDTYTLSGTLATGTDTITVTYGGKSAFFTVNVAEWVVSITAVFTQGDNVVYDIDTLDSLRQYLVVTANFADSTSAAVSDYTLSGTLADGPCTIEANYYDKSDSFSVTVTGYYNNFSWIYPEDADRLGIIRVKRAGTAIDTGGGALRPSLGAASTTRCTFTLIRGLDGSQFVSEQNTPIQIDDHTVYPVPVPPSATTVTVTLSESDQYLALIEWTYNGNQAWTRLNDSGWQQYSYTKTLASGATHISVNCKASSSGSTAYNDTTVPYPGITITFA